jgi:hypothetical protein
MKKTLLTLTAALGLTISANAQYIQGYMDRNGNISGQVYESTEQQLDRMDRDWRNYEQQRQQQAIQNQYSAQLLDQETVQMAEQLMRQKIQQFSSDWNYKLSKPEKTFYCNAVPGFRAAVAHNDWSAAVRYYSDWFDAEVAYEKRYHRCSPGFMAAARVAHIKVYWGRRVVN